MENKRPRPNLAMRFNDHDIMALRELSAELDRSQTDTVRVLVREAHHILPELKRLSARHPKPKPTGRPKAIYSLSKGAKTARVSR